MILRYLMAVFVLWNIMPGKAQVNKEYVTRSLPELEIKNKSVVKQLDSLARYSKADFGDTARYHDLIWFVSVFSVDSAAMVKGMRNYKLLVVPELTMPQDKDLYGFFKIGGTLFVVSVKTRDKDLFKEKKTKEIRFIDYDDTGYDLPTYFYYFLNDILCYEGKG